MLLDIVNAALKVFTWYCIWGMVFITFVLLFEIVYMIRGGPAYLLDIRKRAHALLDDQEVPKPTAWKVFRGFMMWPKLVWMWGQCAWRGESLMEWSVKEEEKKAAEKKLKPPEEG